jgi:shikimate dehydrogenase
MGVPYAEVIGDPVSHSKSPLIHNFWLEKLGIEGDYRSARVQPDDLARYLGGRRNDPDWRGCSVTMPLKQLVPPHLESLDELARRVGAANVAVLENGLLRGYNTDAIGFAEVFSTAARDPQAGYVARRIDLVGAGGAARAIAAALRGSDVTIYNRDKAKADRLSDEFGFGSLNGSSAPLEALFAAGETDVSGQRCGHVVINASSLGMRGYPPLPVRLDKYPADTIVLDLVYDPLETPLLREARRLGMRAVDGLELLVAQARHAFGLFFGAEAPREHDAELRGLLTA